MKVTTVIAWGLVSVLTLFAVINSNRVHLNFLWIADATVPVSLAMFLSAGVGFAACWLMRLVKKDQRK